MDRTTAEVVEHHRIAAFPLPAATPPVRISIARPLGPKRLMIVGWRRTLVSDFHAFLWEDGTVTDIGDAFGVTTWSNALDVNKPGLGNRHGVRQ